MFVYFYCFSLNLEWISYLETINVVKFTNFALALCLFVHVQQLVSFLFWTYNKDKSTKRIAILHSIAQGSLRKLQNNLCLHGQKCWTLLLSMLGKFTKTWPPVLYRNDSVVKKNLKVKLFVSAITKLQTPDSLCSSPHVYIP